MPDIRLQMGSADIERTAAMTFSMLERLGDAHKFPAGERVLSVCALFLLFAEEFDINSDELAMAKRMMRTADGTYVTQFNAIRRYINGEMK